MGETSAEDQAREAELVFNSMPRRYRRRAHKTKKPAIQWPDVTRGMSNHERMMLKKIGRGGVETRSRARRNRSN